MPAIPFHAQAVIDDTGHQVSVSLPVGEVEGLREELMELAALA